MSKIIGLTGGIGSGKTTVAKLFLTEGIPVYFADDEAKKILDQEETISQVVNEFGSEILFENKIDRKKIAEIVFKNPEKLKKLNQIIHPLVKKHFDAWVVKNQKHPFLVKEAAILFESGSYKYCDIIVCVVASEEIRIKRVIERDNTTKDAVLERLKNQWSDQQRIEKSDFVIQNEDYGKTKLEFYEILKKIKNIQ
ncbi:MAG: dephospho-CoA kinase [Limnohabitans sp.]|nr:dephospho-CoA kinase [Limnohabitans sp.]